MFAPVVWSPNEAVQHGLFAAFTQFEDRSEAESATCCSGAVEVTCRVPNQFGKWICPVRPSGEVVQHSFRTVRIQLVHHAVAKKMPTTGVCGAVKVVLRVPN